MKPMTPTQPSAQPTPLTPMTPMTPASASAFEQARACFMAGNAALQAGRLDEAEAQFTASLQALPGRPSTLVNLAAVRRRLGRPAEAVEPLQQALAAQPGDVDAWHQLGAALLELGRHEAALQALDQALGRAQDHMIATDAAQAGVHYRRGLALVGLQRRQEAAQAWEQALREDDRFIPAWVDLGTLMRDLGQYARARQCLDRAAALGADDPVLHFQMRALRDGQPPPQAPPSQYVQRLFDEYAEGFDAHLVGALGYDTPQTLAEGLSLTGVAHFATALDLGCGTGLCAPPLAPWVGQLDGVDLSARMIDRARALGRYRHLEQADAVDYLQRTERRYALVVAADVFIYVGALEGVFAGVDRVLEPGGVLCFSVERAEEPASGQDLADPGSRTGYVLRPTLRYAHTEAYLQRLAHAHGLQVCASRRHALRQDHAGAIEGLCMWMRKPSHSGVAGGDRA